MTGAKAVFYAEIEPYELACRILEGLSDVERPSGKTAKECFDELDPAMRADLWRASQRAFYYFQEKISVMTRQQ